MPLTTIAAEGETGMDEEKRPQPGGLVPVGLGRPGWTMVASGMDTNAAFELFEERRDRAGGPPPHVHRDREELFHVLEGRYVFTRGHDQMEVEAGGTVLIPRGTRHHFRTLVEPSRTLILIVPAGLEGFFREMGTELAAGRSALEAMTLLSARFDSHPVD
jgi:mannose-6-phosphate isomerase-like protein (cupin superfamily)